MGRDPDASGSTLRWVAAWDNSQNDLHKWFFRTKKNFAKWHPLVWFPWWTGSIEGNEERICSKNISGLNPNGHFWKSVVGLSSLCFARFVSVIYQPSMYICIFPRGPKSYAENICISSNIKKGPHWPCEVVNKKHVGYDGLEMTMKAQPNMEVWSVLSITPRPVWFVQ